MEEWLSDNSYLVFSFILVYFFYSLIRVCMFGYLGIKESYFGNEEKNIRVWHILLIIIDLMPLVLALICLFFKQLALIPIVRIPDKYLTEEPKSTE
ncbi:MULTISPECIES: hypothetical protein [unclassified Psychrobacillus]|uniref:hypothetical protein n=1 Tax=unclassified Psychrobacillus TaxID=2636677 RepID=UPI0030FA8EC1